MLPSHTLFVPFILLVAACGEVASSQVPDAAVDAPTGPTCVDGLKNGSETDVDCGGAACGACADARSCSTGPDCQSGVCTNNVCAAPTCLDGVANADELDVDCGGHCGDGTCDFGQTCNATDAACASGSCTANGCAVSFAYTGAAETLTIPAGVTQVTIEAFGAGGGANPGQIAGRGAQLRGTFTVAAGDVLTIAVGGTGVPGIENGGFTGGGGGGGSGVLRGTTALVIAGGGGGAGHQTPGTDAVVGADGTAGFSASLPGGPGGMAGADGSDNAQASAAGGRGWNLGVVTPGEPKTQAGGWGLGGGGGGSGPDGHGGGGGGGYSGGGGGWDGGGGGGGSINTGANPVNTAGVQVGHGRVTIAP